MLTLRGSNKTTVKEIWQQEVAPTPSTPVGGASFMKPTNCRVKGFSSFSRSRAWARPASNLRSVFLLFGSLF